MTSALLPTYVRAPLAFERGEGAWLVTEAGERYLDFGAGIAVNGLGHAHPHLVGALTEQASRIWHTSNLFEIPGGERFGRRLVDATFADVAFFCNSGAEANEAAIKIARKYHAAGGNPERYRIVTFAGAFHGRTLATLAAGGQQKYIEGFGPKVEGFDQVPAGDFAALEAVIGEETAALMIEPIQGEGGVRVIPHADLRRLREICDAHGLLLIMDEVQTGVGRTGKLFAHEWSGITPDIMSVAKGIGGGFPMGACLATREAARGMTAGSHGTTFGGNPLAMAVGNAVLDVVLADGFLDRVACRAAAQAEAGRPARPPPARIPRGPRRGTDARPQARRAEHGFCRRRPGRTSSGYPGGRQHRPPAATADRRRQRDRRGGPAAGRDRLLLRSSARGGRIAGRSRFYESPPSAAFRCRAVRSIFGHGRSRRA